MLLPATSRLLFKRTTTLPEPCLYCCRSPTDYVFQPLNFAGGSEAEAGIPIDVREAPFLEHPKTPQGVKVRCCLPGMLLRWLNLACEQQLGGRRSHRRMSADEPPPPQKKRDMEALLPVALCVPPGMCFNQATVVLRCALPSSSSRCRV